MRFFVETMLVGLVSCIDIDLASFNSSDTTGFVVRGTAKLRYGNFVSSAGDFNKDGFGDIVVASYDYEDIVMSSCVIFGKVNGFSDIDMASFASSDSTGFFVRDPLSYAVAVSSAGDVNKDGFGDILVATRMASPNAKQNAGTSYVIFGKANGISDINLTSFTSSDTTGFVVQGAAAEDGSGNSVSSAGDFNKDGFGDILVGAPNASPNAKQEAGASYVIFGKANGISDIDLASFTSSDTTGFVVQGAAQYDYSGYTVGSAGDVNKDGFGDILVAAPENSPNAKTNAGTSYVIFGKANGISDIDLASFITSDTTGFVIQGAAAQDRSGSSVSSAGDVNKDGFGDILVGAPYANQLSGASYIIFGKANGFSDIDLASFITSDTTGFVVRGAATGELSGRSVSSAGDFNNDGFGDILVGAPYASPNRTGAGASYVIFGKANGFSDIDLASFTSSETTGFVIQGAYQYDYSGNSVSFAGDVNNDGGGDILVGAATAESKAGAAYIIFGTPSPTASPTTTTVSPTTASPTTATAFSSCVTTAPVWLVVAVWGACN